MATLTDRTVEYPSYSVSVNSNYTENVLDFFGAIFGGNGEGFLQFLSMAWSVWSVIAFVLSAIFIYGIIYSYIRINEYGEMKTKQFAEEERLWRELNDPDQGNRRWRDVEEHVQSNNPNDWKLAIIEADVMLEQMLEEAGFAGTTIADRLRSASSRSFVTIDDAWQAHRVRNQIAHGGTDFVLTQKMAQTTIVQYRKVFEEFGVV